MIAGRLPTTELLELGSGLPRWVDETIRCPFWGVAQVRDTPPCDHRLVRATQRSRCGLLLSGGIDSAVVASLLRSQGWLVEALWVDYGQPAAVAERAASRAISDHYGMDWREMTVRGPHVPPEGEVPGRNDMFVAVAGTCVPGLSIAIGVHAGTPYADCSKRWLDAWRALLDVQHMGTVALLAPLADLHKGQVLALARECGVPLGVTYSCERAQGPCGQCLSCQDRVAASVGA